MSAVKTPSKAKSLEVTAIEASPVKIRSYRWLLIPLAVIFVIVLSLVGLRSVYAAKSLPKTTLAGVEVGNLTGPEIRAKLESELTTPNWPILVVQGPDGASQTLKPETLGPVIDWEASAESAIIGNSRHSFRQFVWNLAKSYLLGQELGLVLTLDEAKLNAAFEPLRTSYEQPLKQASLVLTSTPVSLQTEQTGLTLDTAHLVTAIKQQYGRPDLSPTTINLKLQSTEPEILAQELEPLRVTAENFLAQEIKIDQSGQLSVLARSNLADFIQLKHEKNIFGSQLSLELKTEGIDRYLKSLASQIDREAVDAKIAIAAGQLSVTAPSQTGLKLDLEASKTALIRLLSPSLLDPESLASNSPSNTEAPSSPDANASPLPTATKAPAIAKQPLVWLLSIKTIEPEINSQSITNLGIKERIAVSTTDFKGSPNNRVENIRLGTRLFNGIILSPGEQFSAVKSLGRIDESAGFKPELVIKQDQLVPEVGGGLCQVSSTLFRAALNAGLPIDERRNHRFRVSYYEARPSVIDPEDYVTNTAKTLVGLDATIYDPAPDFKFTNDTGKHLLIVGKLEGTRLTFELFGSKDGRQVSIEGPFITSNSPAPTEIVYIDEPNLPLGQTKLKEKAHGATKAYFKYSVKRGGETLQNKTFTSSYTAWQAKYYRGTGAAGAIPSPTATPTATATATATPSETAVNDAGATVATTPTPTPTP